MSADTAHTDALDLTLGAEERPAAPPGKPARRLRRTWSRMRFRVGGSLGEATTAPAVPAVAVEEAEGQQSRRQKQKKSWREQRWERRRKRRVFEEVLGWILVPLILLIAYWAVKSGLSALGTTPSALIQGIRAAIRGGGAL